MSCALTRSSCASLALTLADTSVSVRSQPTTVSATAIAQTERISTFITHPLSAESYLSLRSTSHAHMQTPERDGQVRCRAALDARPEGVRIRMAAEHCRYVCSAGAAWPSGHPHGMLRTLQPSWMRSCPDRVSQIGCQLAPSRFA